MNSENSNSTNRKKEVYFLRCNHPLDPNPSPSLADAESWHLLILHTYHVSPLLLGQIRGRRRTFPFLLGHCRNSQDKESELRNAEYYLQGMIYQAMTNGSYAEGNWGKSGPRLISWIRDVCWVNWAEAAEQ